MFFVNLLGTIMNVFYKIVNNYGLAIIIFTIFSKLILIPISLIVQKNSIKVVKMQPKINQIKIDYFGDKDKIADEQSILYKKEKYNPLTSLIPLVVQIVLLIGLVEVINHPLTYITNIPKDVSKELMKITVEKNSLNEESSSLELSVVKDIKENKYIEEYKNTKITEKQFKKIENLELSFLGVDLTWVAVNEKGFAFLIPFIAGLSALILCIGQNKMNVLQAWQSKTNKYGTLAFSVGLSLYLGAFVPAGVALYWIASNLLALLQQWILNKIINPKKYIDFEALNKTSDELKELNNCDKKNKRSKEQIKKEKQDYKRFFSVVNKHLVFYSESNGFYKYYKGIIEYLLENTNIVIHYITSDYNDNIFELEKNNKQIKAYYIEEKKLITLMMKLDTDVFVMTMPDLQNYHIKRSYVRKDIEYIFIPHSMISLNLTMRKASMNHYDTVFATGKYQKEEAIATNKIYNLKDRKIIEWGYTLLDDMLENYKKKRKKNDKKTILIAPSWQKDNIVDLCLDEILDNLKDLDYKIIVRPHPQHVRHMKEKFENMKKTYKNNENIIIQTDFSSNDTVFNADLMITDWSGISYEYAFTTKKPVIFIDTPMKIMNPDYKELNIEPFNVWSRDVIGKVVKVNKINTLPKVLKEIIKNDKEYSKKISKLVDDSVYNIGKSGEVGAEYIIEAIQNKVEERKNKNE